MANRRREQEVQADPKDTVARGYFRISDLSAEEKAAMARGERTFYSDALQIRNIKTRVEQKGWTFDEEGTDGDLDVSAFKRAWDTRPAIRKHMDDAKKGLFNKLVVFKASRLGRDMLETLTLLKEFAKHGVSVYFVSEELDSDNGANEMLLNIWLAFAQGQSQDMGAFLAEAFRQRAIEGKTHGALPTWIGRKKVLTEEGPKWTAVLIPEQVDNMRRLVELRSGGMGYAKTAQTMNAEGRFTSRGRYWTMGMVAKYTQEDWIRTMRGVGMYGRGQDDCIEIPKAFEPIIEEEEADRLRAVQALYKETRDHSGGNATGWVANKEKKRGRLSGSTTHLLSGLVRCPRCDGAMVGGKRSDDLEHRSTPLKYQCPNAVTHPGHIKSLNSVVATGIDDAVIRVVRGALKEPPPETPKPKPKRAAGPRRSAKALEEAIRRMRQALYRGAIEEAEFDADYPRLKAELDALLTAESEDVVPEQLRLAHEIAGSEALDREKLRQLVAVMVEKVEANVLQEGETIRVGHRSLRRLARVTLRFPRGDGKRVFLAPIYTARWKGKKEFWHCDEEPQNGVIANAGTRFQKLTAPAWKACVSLSKTASLLSQGSPTPLPSLPSAS